jgi:hypothetical protein
MDIPLREVSAPPESGGASAGSLPSLRPDVVQRLFWFEVMLLNTAAAGFWLRRGRSGCRAVWLLFFNQVNLVHLHRTTMAILVVSDSFVDANPLLLVFFDLWANYGLSVLTRSIAPSSPRSASYAPHTISYWPLVAFRK